MAITNLLCSAGLVIGGSTEGFMLSQCGMFAPESFRRQMRFENFLLMKVFMSGVGASMLTQSAMSVVAPERWSAARSYATVSNGYRNVIPGTVLLGVGMTLAGSGPTMIPTQLGMQVDVAGVVLGGALTGGLLYGLAERFMGLKEVCPRKPNEKVLLEQFVGGSYARLAVPAGLALFGAVASLEYLYPHAADAEALGLPAREWYIPMAAGLTIGLNQIPVRLIGGMGQGGTTAVMNMVGTITNGVVGKRFRMDAFAKSWQFVYLYGGTMLGAAVAHHHMVTVGTPAKEEGKRAAPFASPHGFDYATTFAGAVLMVIGARIAGGCTCGHGISGVSELAVQSVSGACGMFAGGIATAYALSLPTTSPFRDAKQ